MRLIRRKNFFAIGIILYLFSMFVFAWQDVLSKILVTASYDASQIAFVRNVIFFIVLIPFFLKARKRRNVAVSRRPFLQIFRSFLMLSEMILFATAFKYISIADAHAIMASFPLIVTAFSPFLLGETIGIRRILAILIGFIGMLFITRPGFETINIGTWLILACAFIYALFIVLTRKVGKYDKADTSLFYQSSTGIVGAAFIIPFTWVWPDFQGWMFLLALSLLAALSYSTITIALKLSDASYLQPFSYSLLIWAIIWGYVIFDDFPDAYTLFGAFLIVMGGLYALWRERVKKTSSVPEKIPLR